MPLDADTKRFYRVWDNKHSRVIKVDRSKRSHDRELLVIGALDGVLGVPLVLETGSIEGWHWISFADPGRWNLLSVRTADIGRRLGQSFGQMYSLPLSAFPQPTISNDMIRSEHASALRQLRPMRRRLRLEAELFEDLQRIPAPIGSAPRPAHLGDKGRRVFVDDTGNVTIMGWDDGGIAPPEWDFTQALSALDNTTQAATALAKSTQLDPGPIELHRWIVFHTIREMLTRANNYQGPAAIQPLVERLQRAIRVAILEKTA